jgi:leucyl/phenylalanyl-tRNA--protein transferase
LTAGGPLVFPDPSRADDEGLLAIGGDLSVERLLLAYRSGIFPWYDEGVPPLWWSPNPRAVFLPGRVHVSRSLRRRLRQAAFELSYGRAFERVIQECGRRRAGGTWILPEVVAAYRELHRRGHAFSIEAWSAGELVGGVYGVQVGGFFAAESMFHRRTDASKVALVSLLFALFSAGIELVDVQFLTPHLASLGAVELSRSDYLGRLQRLSVKPVSLGALDVGSGAKLALNNGHLE